MATVYVDIFNTIRCKFGTDIEDALPIFVQYDNAPDPQPDDCVNGWVRLRITPESSRQVDVGAAKRRFRVRGVAIALVHFPIQAGDGENLEVADAIVNAFRGLTFQGVTFQTPVVRNLGRKGSEWQTEISCPFFKDNLL